ncbi:DNA helicase [Tanacetum coccineum]
MTGPDVKNAKPRQDANATGNYTEALLLKLLGRLGVNDTVDNDIATGNASSHVNTPTVHPVAYHTNVSPTMLPTSPLYYPSTAPYAQYGITTFIPGQETSLPYAFTVGTLHDLTNGTWNMDTCASSYLNASVTNLNVVFNMRDLYPVTAPSPILHAFLVSQHTWHQRLGHPGSEVIRRLYLANGTLSHYKACLVANGSTQLEGVDVDETFSLVVKPGTIRTVLSLAVSRHWPIHLLDVKNAFLHVDLSEICIIALLHQKFSMTDMGSLNYSLCTSITQDSSRMFLSQKKYVVKILKRAHMVNCNSSRTPVDTESKLGDDGASVSDLTFYWSLADADWAGCPTTQRSTSSYCIFLGNNLLSCSSKRQPMLSRSSADAEYRGVANVVVETFWLRNLLRELHTPLSFATLVYYDNGSAVYLSCNLVHHQRTKHIKIDIHFVRDLVTVGHLCARNVLPRCSSSLQDAYAFERFSQLCAMDTTVCSQSPSSNIVITNNIRNAQSISNDSIATAVAINEDFSRQSIFWFQNCSSTLAGLLASRSSKRVHCNVFQRTLSAKSSPLKRRRPSTARVTNTHMPEFNNVNGSLCSLPGEPIRFLQLYIYDTEHELENMMLHFGRLDNSDLDPEIVQGLIHFLDIRNELVQLFRTARDRCQEIDIIEFNIRLYNGDGARGYKLPASNTHGVIVFDSGLTSSTEFGVVIEHIGCLPKRIKNLHKSYMSLQFPLLFINRQSGFHTELKLRQAGGSENERRVMMLTYYAYQLHPRGGPRYMYAHYLDALAICRKLDSVSKIQEPEDVDRLILAELPDPQTNPQGYKVVSEMMIHGPCGAATCMQVNKCIKGFPKKFTEKLFLTTKVMCTIKEETQAHINVEYYGWSMLIKYLFKYVSKGTDRIFSRVFRPLGESSNAAGSSQSPIDEIQNYLEANEDGRHLTYLDFPSEFVWYDDRKSWSPRQNSKSSVGRLAYVHPTLGELFYFRMLCHQKGCKDFSEVQIVHDIFYPTCRAMCEALGLIEDNNEWDIAMQEACASAKLSQLRFLFAHILTHYEGYILYEIEIILNNYGKSLQHFELGPPPLGLLDMVANRLLMEDRNYNEKELQQQKAKSVPKLNVAQRKIYDLIINAIATNQQELVYMYGHGGTGKTLLWKTIISALCSEKKCSGSRVIRKNSHLGKLLVDIDLIIWDEAPKNDKRCFEALDRSLRDILTTPHRLFGGKSILLGGDFRQTLPVKKETGSMAAFRVPETQFHKFIKSQISLDNDDVIMTRKRVNERQMQTIEENNDTSKSLNASLVDTKSSGTESGEQDTSSRLGNDVDADDVDIKPVLSNLTSIMKESQFLKEKSNEAKVKNDMDVIETINIELDYKVAKLLKDDETLKKHYGKPILQPHRNQSVVRQPTAFKSERPRISKPWFSSQVDVNNDFSKPVTTHYLPNERESAIEKPHHVIASSESRNSSKNMPRFSSNDMVHYHYLDDARKKTQEKGRCFKTIGLRWVPIGKIYTFSTTKIDSKTPHGSDTYITNLYECIQTFDSNVGTSINVWEEQNLDLSAGTPFNLKKERIKAWIIENVISGRPRLHAIALIQEISARQSFQGIRKDLTFLAGNPVNEILPKLNLPDHRYKRWCCSLIPAESVSLPHAHI